MVAHLRIGDALGREDVRAQRERSLAQCLLRVHAVATLAQRVGVDPEQALRERALSLRADILAAEGVPDPEMGNY